MPFSDTLIQEFAQNADNLDEERSDIPAYPIFLTQLFLHLVF